MKLVSINKRKILPIIILSFFIILLFIIFFWGTTNKNHKLWLLFLICFLFGMLITFFLKSYICDSFSKCFSFFISNITQGKYTRNIEKLQKDNHSKKIPKITGLDISTISIPLNKINGDCYDIIPLNENETLIYLGDANSSKINPDLLVNSTNFLIISLFKKEITLKELIIKLNEIITNKTASNIFITAVFSIWNKSKNRLSIVQAGHEEILYFDNFKKKVTKTKKWGIPIASPLFTSKNINQWNIYLFEQKINLHSGDYLLYYSDGIIETINNKNIFFGKKKLIESFQTACLEESNPQTIKKHLLNDLLLFNNNNIKLKDDMTLVVIRIT